MKTKVFITLSLYFILQIFFLFCWINALDKNNKLLQDQVYNYQCQAIEKNKEQDKEIRLLKQDILILQEGYKDAE